MRRQFTLAQAASALGVKTRSLRERMLAAEWIVDAGGIDLCTPGAIAAGFVVPVTQARPGLFRTVTVEVDRRLTRKGLAVLKSALACR